MRYVRSVLLAVLIAAATAAAPAYAGTATGPVYFQLSWNRWYPAPNGTTVKFCKSNVAGGITGAGECYSTTTSGGNFSINLPNLQGYFFFAWYDPYDLGSDTTRAWSNSVGGTGDLLSFGTSAFMNVLSDPRPHKPTAVYPANNATNVPLAFTLRWTSGIDYDRDWPGVWTVTYDIYAYGEGGTELKVLSDIPCNGNNGSCTYYIDNVVPNWRYFWRVVAKIHAPYPAQTRTFEQSSQQFTFVTQP